MSQKIKVCFGEAYRAKSISQASDSDKVVKKNQSDHLVISWDWNIILITYVLDMIYNLYANEGEIIWKW